jgi:uncharacterized OB-fold protein
MNKFEQELKNNNFLCSYCVKCNKLVWPPSDYCNKCFNEVVWRSVSRVAKLVEFSSKDKEYFCIAEFEGNIRVMGHIEDASNLQIGQPLFLEWCDYNGTEKFVFKALSKV